MKIIIDIPQFDYLSSNLKVEDAKLYQKMKVIHEKLFVTIQITEDDADEFNEWLNEKLQKVGFDKNYKLTKEGKLIESLIDIFYI